MAKKALCLLLVCSMAALTFLAGCNTQPQQATAVASDDKYRNFYEIFVYSFCDSDGDGIGDINGITQKLDYLNDGDPNGGDDLGIDGIWLMPIMPSPSYHKYDVTDYYDIHPDYGTLEDFERFTAECEKRGIDVIIDLVLNHTSSEHPWFIAASERQTATLNITACRRTARGFLALATSSSRGPITLTSVIFPGVCRS